MRKPRRHTNNGVKNNMRYKFRITLKQQLLVLFPFISINTFIGLGFLYIAHGSHMNGVFLGLILFIALVNVFPTVVLHLQYLIRNGGAIFLIDVENNNMKYKKG